MPPSARLHQPQIIAVASPPPKQHLTVQKPTGKIRILKYQNHSQKIRFLNFALFIGANNSRPIPPPLSPQGQQGRPHNLQQPGLPAPGFETNLVSGY